MKPAPQVNMSQIYVDVSLQKDRKLSALRELKKKVDSLD